MRQSLPNRRKPDEPVRRLLFTKHFHTHCHKRLLFTKHFHMHHLMWLRAVALLCHLCPVLGSDDLRPRVPRVCRGW